MQRNRQSHWPSLGAAILGTVMLTACSMHRASAPVQTDLVIAATTDVHGRLRAWDYYTNMADPAHSLAGAATIVDSVRHAHPGAVVLVDAGDLLQGNPLTYVAAKVQEPPVHPVIAAMNVMQYDAAVIGNHEFNYGVDRLRRAIGQSAFPFLAANVTDRRGQPFAASQTMVTRRLTDGSTIRVGIVGATTPGSMIWDAENLRDAGLSVSDIVPAVQRAVADLRRQKADVVVALLHSGFNEPASYDTVDTHLPSENVAERVAREVPGVEVVVFGHSHKEIIDSLVNGVLVVQPRNWAASVALATLSMERRGKVWHVAARRGQAVRVAGHSESPAVLAASQATHRAAVAWATAPVGETVTTWRSDSARLVDTPITDFVNEVMRRETGAQLSATSVFSLQATFAKGPITLAALSTLYPYDNTLRAIRISGAQLRAFLEFSSRYYRTVTGGATGSPVYVVDPAIPGYNFDIVTGADYTMDLQQPMGHRIVALSVNGRPVVDSDTFTMAINSYRAGGGGGYAMLAGAPVVYQRDVDIRQLLIDEVRRVTAAGQMLDPQAYSTLNWHILPAVPGGAPRRTSPPASPKP